MTRKKFKRMFEVVQTLVFPVILVLVTYLLIGYGFVAPEAVDIVWTVIIINVIANLISIVVAAWFVEK